MACTSHVCDGLPVGRQVQFFVVKLFNKRQMAHDIDPALCARSTILCLFKEMTDRYRYYKIYILDFIIIICRFNARSYFERVLVLLDDNVVK